MDFEVASDAASFIAPYRCTLTLYPPPTLPFSFLEIDFFFLSHVHQRYLFLLLSHIVSAAHIQHIHSSLSLSRRGWIIESFGLQSKRDSGNWLIESYRILERALLGSSRPCAQTYINTQPWNHKRYRSAIYYKYTYKLGIFSVNKSFFL